MSDDWKPDDLALCVRGGYLPFSLRGLEMPQRGRIYTVSAIRPDCLFRGGRDFGLALTNGPPNIDFSHTWPASRFRKINPLTDEERKQFAADLNERVPA
jgi:hypothetical protein